MSSLSNAKMQRLKVIYIFPRAFCETTPSQGFYGLEKIETDDAKVRRKEKRREKRGKRLCNLFRYYIVNFGVFEGQKTIRTTALKKHDLSRPIFKNSGRYTSTEL